MGRDEHVAKSTKFDGHLHTIGKKTIICGQTSKWSVSPKDHGVSCVDVRTANEGDLDCLKDRFAKVCELIVRGVSDN